MKQVVLAVLATFGSSSATAAQDDANQLARDQQAVARAQAAHKSALKSHDAGRISRTAAQLRAADQNAFNDRRAATQENAPPANGDTRASELRVIEARDAREHALASGDAAAINRTSAALRLAEQQDFAIRHHLHPDR